MVLMKTVYVPLGGTASLFCYFNSRPRAYPSDVYWKKGTLSVTELGDIR